MTKNEAFTILKRRLGAMQSPHLDDTIHAELQFAQEFLLEGHKQLPWFLESEVATKPTEPNEARVPLPQGFIRECEGDEGALWVLGSNGEREVELCKASTAVLAREYSTTPGEPRKYNVQGEYIKLAPIPDIAYDLLFIFYQRDTPYAALTAQQENKWLREAADWLIAEAGFSIASKVTQYNSLADAFGKDRQAARARVMANDRAQREANRERNKGRRRRRRGA